MKNKNSSYSISEITRIFPQLFLDIKKIDKRKNIFQYPDRRTIYFQSSLINDYKTYYATWNAIKWEMLDKIDSYCLIVENIGIFIIPMSIIKEYSKYSPSKNESLFHVRFRISPEMEFISASGMIFDHSLKQYFIPIESFEESNLVEVINEETFEETLNKALLFQDFKEQYSKGNNDQRYRIESKAQKERISKLENHTCQICGYRYEYKNAKGQTRWIIEVDHIKEKSLGGGEEIDNMLVLCPNCHAKKTKGVIKFNIDYTFNENGIIHKLLHNKHLGIYKHKKNLENSETLIVQNGEHSTI